MWLVVFRCFLLAAVSSLIVDNASADNVTECLKSAKVTCDAAASVTDITYCDSLGHKYHGPCELATAMCHHFVDVISTGDHCQFNISKPTTTTPPPSHFEVRLFEAMKHGIDDRLEASQARGITPAQAKPIFSKQDHTNKVYVRNPDCWAYGLDLTAISPWNSNLHNRKAGTLVSPRHAVWARHYNIKLNSTLRFVDARGGVVERRVVAERFLDLHGGLVYGHDLVVGLLDSDVPSYINHVKVMPHGLIKVKPPHNDRIPVLSTDQEEKALVTDLFQYGGSSIMLTVPPKSSVRFDYYESKIVGDSGNPTFLVIDGELVLLFVFTTGGAGGGTNIVNNFEEINRLVNDLGGGYQLTEINLDRYLDQGETIPNIIG